MATSRASGPAAEAPPDLRGLGHGLFRRETCAATAEVVCVLFDLATHRPTVIAPDLRRFLEAMA